MNNTAMLCFFALPLLLLFSCYNVTTRYFIILTPLLIYLASHHKPFWIYNILFLFSLFMLKLGGNTQQWGLFSPFDPTFFSSLPILGSYLTTLVDIKTLHQIMYRIFFVSSLAMVLHLAVYIHQSLRKINDN